MVWLILIDSNVWIFAELQDYEEFAIANKVLKDMWDKEDLLVNDIVLSEVYHKLSFEMNRDFAARRVTHILESDKVAYLPVSKEQMRKAIQLAKVTQLRINDSLIAEQCLDTKAPVLTDNVKDFRRVAGLKVLPLR